MNTWVVITIVWIVCLVFIFVSRLLNQSSAGGVNKKMRLRDIIIGFLFAPIIAPTGLFVMIYEKCKQKYYKNRPRPLPKKLRKFLKADTVADEERKTVSIAEYNWKHGTNFTLDDVYGKGYMESLSDEEKASIVAESLRYGVLHVSKDVADTIYTVAAKELGDALLTGDFTDFENRLAENVEHINHGAETFFGKKNVAEYWKDWKVRYVDTKQVTNYEVSYSEYYSNSCLLLDSMVVMFFFEHDKIRKILFCPQKFEPFVADSYDNILKAPFDYEFLKPCLSELRGATSFLPPVVKENRIPCMSCGMPSEKLEWYSFERDCGIHGYLGVASVCPHCHKLVEYYPEMRLRYDRKRLKSYMHAAEIICACWNNLDTSIIEPYLSEDVIWNTQKGKANYLEFLEKRFASLKLLKHGFSADIVCEDDKYRARITIDHQDEDEVYRLTIESGLITEIQVMPSSEWWKKQLGTSPFGVISQTSLHEQAAAVAVIEQHFKTELGNKTITWATPYELKNSHCQLSFNCEGLDYDVLVEIHSWDDKKCRFAMKSEFDRLKAGCQENDHIPCILALDEEDQFVSFTLVEKMEVIIPKLRSKGIDECAFRKLFKK